MNQKKQDCCKLVTGVRRSMGRMASAHDEVLARMAKALGHPVRVKIVRYLTSRTSCICGDIVDQIGLAQSTVSQHLKVLKAAGLIRGEIDAPKVCYCINPEAIQHLKQLVGCL